MVEYCIFQKNFSLVVYLIHPISYTKHNFIANGSQIPKKCCNLYSEEEKIDLCLLNCINSSTDLKYIFENDYLVLLLFLNTDNIFFNLIKYAGVKISNYFFNKMDIDKYNNYLIIACKYNNLYLVKLLIENGANINFIDNHESPLFVSIVNGNYLIFNFLIENGADINLSNGFENAFFLICISGKYKMLKKLIKKGLDIHQQEEYGLNLAVLYKNYKIVKYLIKKGADINSLNSSPIKIAIEIGSVKIIKLMIKTGIENYDDCIQFSIDNKKTEITKLLLFSKIHK